MSMLEGNTFTRMELLRAKKKLRFLKRGKDLLELEAESLLARLKAYYAEVRVHQHSTFSDATLAFRALRKNEVLFGEHALRSLADVSKDMTHHAITIEQRSVGGLTVPKIIQHKDEKRRLPFYGFSGSSVFLDVYSTSIKRAIDKLVTLAEMESTIIIMASEYKKLRQRINALEQRIIPQVERLAATIENTLEMTSMEEFTRLKMFKKFAHGSSGEGRWPC